MAQKLTIEFQPKGNKQLVTAIKELNRVTNQLQGTTGDYKNKLDKVNNSYKKVTKSQRKYNKGGITAVKHNRLLSHSLATLRSRLLIVAFGGAIVTKAFKSMFDAAIKQEKAERKLEAQLGKVNKSLLNHAAGLQQITEFGDEAIIEVQALISAFTKDEQQIKSLTEATLDLAAAKGMDLTSAADLVAKSFGSSTNSLSRYGIEVKGAVGSSQRLESLTENIAELFGGQAVAAADTLGGSVEQMKNAFGDANEAVGKAFTPTLQKLLPLLTETANKAREFILGFTEDPLETAVRNMEELGLDASKFRLQLLGIKKMNLFQELGVEMHNVKAVEEEIVQTTNKLKMEQEMIGIAVTNRTKAISEMTGTQAEIEARISKEKSRQFRLQEGIGTHGAQTYATQQNMVDKEAEFVVIQQKNENAAKQGVITNKDRLAQLLQILAIIKEMNTIVVGDDDTDDGFFSKLFGKFGNQEEMEALVGNVAQFVDALSGVANAYDKVKMQQINQAKQAELDSVKGIRNERIRTKKLEEIEAKYAEKTRKHKEKMKTVKVAEAISNTALGATKAWSDPGGFLGMALAAMIVAQGALQIQAIKAQKYQYGGLVGGRRHSQGGTMIEAEQGEFVMSRDATEAIGIENLNRMNTGLGGGGGSTIVINNPILGKDMIEDEIVPQIQEALRRGGDIGV